MHPQAEGVFKRCQSLRDIPGAVFQEALSLGGGVCADIHGDFPLGLYVVPDGIIKGDSAILFTAAGNLISEQNAGLLTNDELLKQITSAVNRSDTPTHKHSQLLSLVSTCTDCFWHWMMDSLPKVFVAEVCGYTGAYLIPGRHAPASVIESLEFLGITRERIIPHDGSSHLAHSLFVPTYFSGFNALYNAELIRRYRNWICSRISPSTPPGLRRIYVARKPTAKARRVTNHDEVARLTQQYGYETIFFENLSFDKQLNLAFEAVSMIAPHGSGMTHILFMMKNSSIIELFPHKRAGSVDCYETLASVLHHSYTSLESTRDCGTDIEIDLGALQHIIDKEGHSR